MQSTVGFCAWFTPPNGSISLAAVEIFTEILSIFECNYPETLGTCYIFNGKCIKKQMRRLPKKPKVLANFYYFVFLQ